MSEPNAVRLPPDDSVTFQGPGSEDSDYHTVRISDIIVDWNGRRRTDPEMVARLKAAILRKGLLHPVTLYRIKNESKLHLAGGAHRLVAHSELGREFVPARIIEVADVEEARDIQDSENLDRNELTTAERCFAHARRKRRHLDEYPEARRGGDRRSSNGRNYPLIGSYASIAAKNTGRSPRTINEDARVGAILEPYSRQIIGSPIEDSMTDLIQLASLSPSDIVAVLDMLSGSIVKTVAEAKSKLSIHQLPQRHDEPIIPQPELPLQDFTKAFGSIEGKTEDITLQSLGQLYQITMEELTSQGSPKEKVQRATSLYDDESKAHITVLKELQESRLQTSAVMFVLFGSLSLLVGEPVQCPVSCPSCAAIDLIEFDSAKYAEIDSGKSTRRCTFCRQIVKTRFEELLEGISSYTSSMGGAMEALNQLSPQIPASGKS
jgi:uncharacterized ParB-like nuclease family protein